METLGHPAMRREASLPQLARVKVWEVVQMGHMERLPRKQIYAKQVLKRSRAEGGLCTKTNDPLEDHTHLSLTSCTHSVLRVQAKAIGAFIKGLGSPVYPSTRNGTG